VQNRQNLDRGLISQKSRDLFARFLKYPGITNYFLTDNSGTGSTSPWTGRARSVHRGPTPARTTGTTACSPELGLRAFRCAEDRWRGCNRERSARGTRLGPHRGSSGVEEDGRRRCRAGRRRRSVRELLRQGEREM
jgi:hypothetical protein